MRPGILPEHGFKHKGNHYASLSWFGTKIAQKYAIKGSKFSGFRRDVKPHVLTFSASGRQVTTFCTCAMSSLKKCHVSGCRRQAGDVCCLRCLIMSLPSSMADFVPCDRLLQKAYFYAYMWFWFYNYGAPLGGPSTIYNFRPQCRPTNDRKKRKNGA